MPISNFPTALANLATAIVALTSSLRAIQSASGDLPMLNLVETARHMRQAKEAAMSMLAEAQKADAAVVERQMADMGGPASLADFQTGLAVIEQAASAWSDRQQEAFEAMPNGWAMVTVSRDGISTRHPEEARFIPANVADLLRQSGELASLVVALEAIGA